MKLQYLGTAAAEGWPGLFCRCPACVEASKRGGKNLRTRSQSIIDDSLVVDFPPDTYMHMLLYGVDFPNLKNCIMTHTHDDHFYWEDMKMRSEWFANDTEGAPFTMYGNDEFIHRMDEIATFPQWDMWRHGMAWQELTEFKPVQIGDHTVTPLLARHNPKEKCFLYIVEKDGKRLLYGNDTGYFPDATWDYIAGKRFDLVSLDCTMLALPIGMTQGHMGIECCCTVRQKLLDTGCADADTVFVINHFSHNGSKCPDGSLLLHEELVPLMAEKGFLVAYDGMTVEF